MARAVQAEAFVDVFTTCARVLYDASSLQAEACEISALHRGLGEANVDPQPLGLAR